jgi:ribosomal protein S18 acetylase RimI-like enzyme
MPPILEDLYRLHKRDTPQAAAVLANAFEEDPVWNAILRDASRAQRAAAFETPVRYCLRYGEVFASSENLEGVAAWVPGALAEMTLWRVVRSGAMWASMKLGASMLKSTNLIREMPLIFRQLEEDRKTNMRGKSYIYLQVIGVAPAHQGQGFGGKLLRALIEKSEQTDMPLYLETETERNVSMYQHYGFHVVRQIVLPVIDLPMWEMVRGS